MSMKTLRYIFILLLLSVSYRTFAQDVISKTDNSTIQCKVTKVSSTEVEYKKWSNLDGPTYVISISDVLNIKYQNGDIDEFSQQLGISVADTISGVLSRSGSDLVLNGALLSDNEVLDLLGEQCYDTYINAKKQLNAGGFFTFVFGASLIGDVALYYSLVNAENSNSKAQLAMAFYISLVATNISLPLMCIFNGIGNGRMNSLVDSFNRKHNKSMTLSLSPSLMNCEMPQLQNTYGVGITFRANF